MNLLGSRQAQVFYLFVFSSLVLTITVRAQQNNRQVFLGRIVSSTTKEPVISSMVYNTTGESNAISDSLGTFSIQVSVGDTLKISRIGYYTKDVQITSSMLITNKIHTIDLVQRVYELKNVNILNLGTYQDFKYKVLNTEVPESEYVVNPEIKKSLNKKIVVLKSQASISLGSPVTGLYNLLSKEGKSTRHLAKAKEKDKIVDSYKYKYSPEVVSNLTGLKELELEKFMKFCNLSQNFILQSSEYDIAEKIIRCFDDYKSRKEMNKTDTIP